MSSSWLREAQALGYGPDNLPYGVFSRGDLPARIGVRIGGFVLDLAGVLGDPVFREPSLNAFMARGSTAWRATRLKVGGRFTSPQQLRSIEPHLVELDRVRLHPPFKVADFVRFCGSLEHARNTAALYGEDTETPSWRYLPPGGHGRSSTIVLSGTDITRPFGQRLPPGAGLPELAPTVRLDLGASLGYVVGIGSQPGRTVRIGDFAQYVFGVMLVNDWCAHDFQAWERVPLGPFLGSSFATSISPWVVPLDALGGARVPGRPQDPPPMPHLRPVADWGLDVEIEIRLNGRLVSRPPFREMYWTGDQMLAHMSSNGAALRTGDFYTSGTVSGARPEERGSLLELSWGGRQPITRFNGTAQSFLRDGDVVAISAGAHGLTGGSISLGEVTGTILPAR